MAGIENKLVTNALEEWNAASKVVQNLTDRIAQFSNTSDKRSWSPLSVLGIGRDNTDDEVLLLAWQLSVARIFRFSAWKRFNEAVNFAPGMHSFDSINFHLNTNDVQASALGKFAIDFTTDVRGKRFDVSQQSESFYLCGTSLGYQRLETGPSGIPTIYISNDSYLDVPVYQANSTPFATAYFGVDPVRPRLIRSTNPQIKAVLET